MVQMTDAAEMLIHVIFLFQEKTYCDILRVINGKEETSKIHHPLLSASIFYPGNKSSCMYPTLTVVACPIIILVVEYETECFNYVVEGRNTVKEGIKSG